MARKKEALANALKGASDEETGSVPSVPGFSEKEYHLLRKAMNNPNLAQKIKSQFESEFKHPFPTADIGKLKSVDPDTLGQFHGELDLYLSSIAGYASSADRLGRRSRAELKEARQYLSESFFEKHRSLAVYRDAITRDSTPRLHQDLLTADKLRGELLMVIDGILAGQ